MLFLSSLRDSGNWQHSNWRKEVHAESGQSSWATLGSLAFGAEFSTLHTSVTFPNMNGYLCQALPPSLSASRCLLASDGATQSDWR